MGSGSSKKRASAPASDKSQSPNREKSNNGQENSEAGKAIDRTADADQRATPAGTADAGQAGGERGGKGGREDDRKEGETRGGGAGKGEAKERGDGEGKGDKAKSWAGPKHAVTAAHRMQSKEKQLAKRERPVTSRGRGRSHMVDKKDEDGDTDVIFELLAGEVNLDCPASDKIVRIFLSSTFTDTSHERNSLMERVYPRLKRWCQERGYQFQVVDMRWGVRDEATDDHRTTELCLKEIDLCKKLSTGVCFVTLLSHKYGYRPFPREFPVPEFEKLLSAVPNEPSRELLSKWFQRDDNAVPPTYVLQPISLLLPDFFASDADLRSKANSQWWEDNEQMQAAIGQAASSMLNNERAHAVKESVTETEIRRGLLADPSLLQRGLWFYRNIQDIADVPVSKISSRFKDGKGSKEKQKESKTMLQELKTELMSVLPGNRLHQYNVTWNKDTGINPEKDAKHRDYINTLCGDFERDLLDLTEKAITARNQGHRVNPLVEEVTQHTRFSQEKCRNFYGRQDALEHVSAYLQDQKRKEAFVIHGKSGSGKTSIVAMAAREACKVHKKKGVVVLRFLGTTPDSTTIGSLLSSILRQLIAAKNRSVEQSELPTTVKELSAMLEKTLGDFSESGFPITLLLDSLDQLDPSNGARQLAWLPPSLPDHVKVIVSTLPEPEYEAFPKLKVIYADSQSNFYEVPTLKDSDVSGILDQWLSASRRQLTTNQTQLLLDAFKACPLPLFLKISFDSACKWHSYSSSQITVLQKTVRESINVIFAGLERMHGETFVQRALGFLTISHSGLTETELEDILSCDDDVLNDVYTYWTPPVRRLPPLLLVRLKADLGQYLVNRGADGIGVLFWYHRQFIEAAYDRYCGDQVTRDTLHAVLADFFSGRWAGGQAKPYTNKTGKSSKADRIVSSQPLKFGDSYNLRKLNNLPYHAMEAGNKTMLKNECLLNYEFLLSKLLACDVRALLDDFSSARKLFPDDDDLKTVAETLQLSQDSLLYDPRQLAVQIISRIQSPPKAVQTFLKQCRESGDTYLLPNKQLVVPPGGQLLHSLNQHNGDVVALDMTSDGKFAVTCSEDQTLCIIDVEEGRRVRRIENIGERPQRMSLCCKDTIIVINTDDALEAFAFNSGIRLWGMEEDDAWCACGVNRSWLATVDCEEVRVHDASTGAKLWSVETSGHMKRLGFSSSNPCDGNEQHVVCVDSGNETIVVVDLLTKKIGPSRKLRRQALFPGQKVEKDVIDFTIDGLAITHDSKFVLCANYMDNDLHFLDTVTLKTIKVLKGSSRDFVEKFHMLGRGQYLFCSNRRAVRLWDLDNHLMASALLHSNNVVDVATVDLRIFVTVSDDRLIRIWDLGRGVPETQTIPVDFKPTSVWRRDPSGTGPAGKEGLSGGSVENPAGLPAEPQEEVDDQAADETKSKIREMVLLSSPRYILLESYIKEGKQSFLQVYDVAKETVVRNALCQGSTPKYIYHVEGSLVLIYSNERLQLVDVDKMSVVRTFQGRPKESPRDCLHLVNHNKDILTVTQGGKHLKLYAVETGKVKAIIKQTASTLESIDTLLVNRSGTIAVAESDNEEKLLLVFDLARREQAFVIACADMQQESLSLYRAAVTDDGIHLIIMETDTSETFMLVYNLQKRAFSHSIVDKEMYQCYQRDTRCKDFKLLDAQRLLSTHDDFLLRIFNFQTGDLLTRIEGHLCSADLYVEPGCPVILTHGSYSEENAFRLWAAADMAPLASFSMDDELDKFMLLGEHGNVFVARTSKHSEPVIFRTVCAKNTALPGNSKPMTTHPELYKGKKLTLTLAGLDTDEGVCDADDPDDDPIIPDDPPSDEDEDEDEEDD